MARTEKRKKSKNINWEIFRLKGFRVQILSIANEDERLGVINVVNVIDDMIKRRKK